MLSAYGTTLAVAAGRGHKSIGRQFLDAGANVNTVLKRDYGTALAATARNGHGCIVRQLLDVGANVNIVSRRWYGTALTGGGERRAGENSSQLLNAGAASGLLEKEVTVRRWQRRRKVTSVYCDKLLDALETRCSQERCTPWGLHFYLLHLSVCP